MLLKVWDINMNKSEDTGKTSSRSLLFMKRESELVKYAPDKGHGQINVARESFKGLKEAKARKGILHTVAGGAHGTDQTKL